MLEIDPNFYLGTLDQIEMLKKNEIKEEIIKV